MTMHVKLSPEMEKYIKDKIASGLYRNSTEVIGDAIRRMREQEEPRPCRPLAITEEEAETPNCCQGSPFANGAPA